jgi:hypothetical protein
VFKNAGYLHCTTLPITVHVVIDRPGVVTVAVFPSVLMVLVGWPGGVTVVVFLTVVGGAGRMHGGWLMLPQALAADDASNRATVRTSFFIIVTPLDVPATSRMGRDRNKHPGSMLINTKRRRSPRRPSRIHAGRMLAM